MKLRAYDDDGSDSPGSDGVPACGFFVLRLMLNETIFL